MANFGQGNSANWGPLKGTDIGGVGNCGCAKGNLVGLLTIAGWSGIGESGGTVIPILQSGQAVQPGWPYTEQQIRKLLLESGIDDAKNLFNKANAFYRGGIHFHLDDQFPAGGASVPTVDWPGQSNDVPSPGGGKRSIPAVAGDLFLNYKIAPASDINEVMQTVLFELGNLVQQPAMKDLNTNVKKNSKTDYAIQRLMMELRNFVDEDKIYDQYLAKNLCQGTSRTKQKSIQEAIAAVNAGSDALKRYATNQVNLYNENQRKRIPVNAGDINVNVGGYYNDYDELLKHQN
jgi:hypothetical protein